MRRIVSLIALLILALAPTADAETVFSYVGDTFKNVSGVYTLQDRITGSFIVADGFAPVSIGGPDDWTPGVISWSFSDGHQTLTAANSTARFNWDPAVPGNQGTYRLDTWVVGVSSNLGTISTAHFGDGDDFGALYSLAGSLDSFGRNGCCAGAGDGSIWGTWTVQQTSVSVPELAILPRLPRLLKFGPGLGLETSLASRFQRATAWSAAAILHAIQVPARQDGVFIDLPSVRVEVAEACSGVQTLALMLAAAALIAVVLPARRLPWALALFVAAVILALEANALRVAGITIGLEQTAGAFAREWKDWIQMGTTGVALAQLVGLGRLAARA